MSDNTLFAKQIILKEADQCVQCGLCLPHCPTYLQDKNENESPRGRIALAQALAREQLSPSEKLQTHLDNCLGCRRCEAMCPAEVSYHSLFQQTQSLLLAHKKTFPRGIRYLMLHPAIARGLGWALWLYQKSGLQFLLRKSRLLPKRLAALDSLVGHAQRPKAHAPSSTAKSISLHRGCMTSVLGNHIEQAACELLAKLGIKADFPKGQVCCGALAEHYGDLTLAQSCQAQNSRAFANHAEIISLNSGCHRTLAQTHRNAQGIFSMLLSYRDKMRCHPLAATVLLHVPCSTTSAEKEAMLKLLSAIPELRVVTAKSACCGAGGLGILQSGDKNQAMRAEILRQAQENSANFVVSSNLGCILQLNREPHAPNHPVVLHLVEFLNKQLLGIDN